MIEILAGFTLGLFGSLHCVGMCGPIAMSIPFHNESKKKIILERLVYNLGRVLTYGFLGLIVGLFGNNLHLLGIQHYISILSGFILLLFVLFPMVWNKFEMRVMQFSIFNTLQKNLGKFIRTKSKLAIGILNGFLPCGFVYIALLAAINIKHLEASILFMLFFGLGTIPLMFISTLIPISFKSLSKFMFHFRKYVTLVLAILFILRGLSLGIPYLSPIITINNHNTIQSGCCEDY